MSATVVSLQSVRLWKKVQELSAIDPRKIIIGFVPAGHMPPEFWAATQSGGTCTIHKGDPTGAFKRTLAMIDSTSSTNKHQEPQ